MRNKPLMATGIAAALTGAMIAPASLAAAETAPTASAPASATVATRQTDQDPSHQRLLDVPYVDIPDFTATLPITPASRSVGTCVNVTQFTVPGAGSVGKYVKVPTSSNGSRDCLLLQGNQSAAVGRLQQNLKNGCEMAASGLAVDNVFGPATKAALQKNQSQRKWTADGIYGSQTARGSYWLTTDGKQCVRLGL